MLVLLLATTATTTVNAMTASLTHAENTAWQIGIDALVIVVALFAVLCGIGLALKVWRKFTDDGFNDPGRFSDVGKEQMGF